MATVAPSGAGGGPLQGLKNQPVQGPRDIKGTLKGGKGPYGGGQKN
jgi:hypothetical protein